VIISRTTRPGRVLQSRCSCRTGEAIRGPDRGQGRGAPPRGGRGCQRAEPDEAEDRSTATADARDGFAAGVRCASWRAKEPRRRRARLRDKGLAAARTAKTRAKARAGGLKQKAAAKAADWGPARHRHGRRGNRKLGTPPPPQRKRPRQPRREGRHRHGGGARRSSRCAGVALTSAARRRLYVRRIRIREWPDGGRRGSMRQSRSRSRSQSRKAESATHVFTRWPRNDVGSLRWTAVTIDTGRRQGRARQHHHPAGCAPSPFALTHCRDPIIVSDEAFARYAASPTSH